MIKLGIIGFGYWGPNLARNFSRLENCTVKAVADVDASRLELVRKLYPHIKATVSANDIFNAFKAMYIGKGHSVIRFYFRERVMSTLSTACALFGIVAGIFLVLLFAGTLFGFYSIEDGKTIMRSPTPRAIS